MQVTARAATVFLLFLDEQKMERIHFKSWTLDRAFTFTEWLEWCRTHDSSYVVATFDRYKYNVHGCCLNRSRAIVVGGRNFCLRIDTSLCPDGHKIGNPLKWEGRIDWTIGDGGGVCCFAGFYDTEMDCVLAGLMAGRDKFQRELYLGRFGVAEKCRLVVNAIDREIANRKQITLF